MKEIHGHKVMMLTGGKKKGILRILFSRFFLMALLLVLQIGIGITIYMFFDENIKLIRIFDGALILVMLLYLFNSEMDSSAKLTWMFIISLFPVVGSLFLAYTQSNIGNRKLTEKVSRSIENTMDDLPQDESVLSELAADNSGIYDLNNYINRSGCFPIYKNTDVTYFPIGEKKFSAMLEELEKAEDFIFMEYFIIDEGYMWGRILEILARKASEGVDVRVMYDGMCDISTLPHNYPKLLELHGIKSKRFSPLRPFVSTHYNYRDHRKILVIDGKVGFTGGVNLADEYINEIERFGHWKDTAVMLKGEAVSSLTLMFLQMWSITQSSETDYSPAQISYKAENAEGYVMPYCDCPLDDDKVGENVYIDMLYHANNYVHIMTPYLILDDELKMALKYAGQRGIDVKIILPGKPDKATAYALAKRHYKVLLDSGVSIYEYTPGFVHAKTFVSDDTKAVVGTINLDYRSLYHHFECAAYMYKTPCISEIEEDYQETLTKCTQVTYESIKNEPFHYKALGIVLKLLAPLM